MLSHSFLPARRHLPLPGRKRVRPIDNGVIFLEYTRQIGKKDRGNSHKHDYFSHFFRYTDTWSYEKPCFSGDCERVILFKGVFQHIQEEVILY